MRTNLYSLRSTKDESAYINQNKRNIAIKLDELSSIRLLFKTDIDSNPRKIFKDFAIDLESDNPPELYIYANALDTQDSSSLRRLFTPLIKAAEKEIAEELFLGKSQRVDVIVHPVELSGQSYKAYCFTLFDKKMLVLPRMRFVKGDYIKYICDATNAAKEIFAKEFADRSPGYLVSDSSAPKTEPASAPLFEEEAPVSENAEKFKSIVLEENESTENAEALKTIVLEENSLQKDSTDTFDSFEIPASAESEEEKLPLVEDGIIDMKPEEASELPETDDEKAIDEEEEPKKQGKVKRFFMSFIPHKGDSFKNVILKIIVLLAIAAFLVGGFILLRTYVIEPAIHNKDMEEIRNIFYDTSVKYVTATNDEGEEVTVEVTEYNWKGAKEKNEEIVAWINIKNANIDYPVLWHKEDNADSQYYLNRNHEHKYTDHGSIFLDYRCTKGTDSKNIILHGHNMGTDSSMFANLTKYAGNTKYYKNAPIVTFMTPEDSSEWIIFSVMKIDVNNKSDTIFNYFLTEFDSDARFMNQIYNIKARSYLNVDVPINENDRIITLSTCSYETETMRTVVVARQLREGEDPDKYIKSVKERSPQHIVYSTFRNELEAGNIDWYDGKGNLEGDEELEYLTQTPMFTVKFLDGNGNVIRTQYVLEGKDAKAPEKTPGKLAEDGYYFVFKKWDKSFKNVTKDLTVKPVFNKIKIPVLGEETTWPTDPDDYRDITEDTPPAAPPVETQTETTQVQETTAQ